MATWAQFLAQTRRTLGEATAGVWSDDSLLYWANEGATDFARKAKPTRDTVTTTSVIGTYSYDLPDTDLEPIAVYFDSKRLARMDIEGVYNLVTELTTNGTPTRYAFADDTLYLVPAPDSTAEIRLLRYRRPDAITTGTDDMPFRSDYDGALMLFVLQRAFEQVADWPAAGEYAARYQAAVNDAMTQETLERKGTSPVEVY